MSSFTSDLLVTPSPDGVTWRLEQPLTYHVGAPRSDTVVTVPTGFVTDFATVPRVFWWLIPRWGKHGNAAVLHDFLYHSKLYTRATSDAIFLEALEVLGVSWFTRSVMYVAVRVFGGWAW